LLQNKWGNQMKKCVTCEEFKDEDAFRFWKKGGEHVGNLQGMSVQAAEETGFIARLGLRHHRYTRLP
jgi:hypothetical protein